MNGREISEQGPGEDKIESFSVCSNLRVSKKPEVSINSKSHLLHLTVPCFTFQ